MRSQMTNFEQTIAAVKGKGKGKGLKGWWGKGPGQQQQAADGAAAAGGGGGGDDAPRPRLPRPDPSFKGCWHCGGSHPGGRRTCPSFQAILKANGGKLPSNYEGAYEKHLKAKGQKNNVMFVAQQDAEHVVAAFTGDGAP